MNSNEIAIQALTRTQNYVGIAPVDWMTFNDKINTRVLHENDVLKTDITLFSDEVPLLECIIDEDYVVITTRRVLSKCDGKTMEIEMIMIESIIEDPNIGLSIEKKIFPKAYLLTVRGGDKNIQLKIDSFYPAYFARILIYNLSSFLTTARWYTR